ncbi:MAG: hypothetical protein GX029_11385 [Pseudomonadaceae bacterium]|nr:hypothetical protein [Pseudomonadaceae bacterium]
MSSESAVNVGNLIGQLESYADKGLGALENAKQEILQLTERVSQLEASQARLEKKLNQLLDGDSLKTDSVSSPKGSLVETTEQAEKVIAAEEVKEALEVKEAVEAEPAIKTAAMALDKLNPQQRLQHWVKSYPRSFIPNQPQPLKVGIHKELLATEGGDIKKIRRALASYVKVPRYLRCIKEGAVRVDLKGDNAGLVSKEEAGFAQANLQKLEQHKKQREAQKKQQQAEQQQRLAEERLQEKLSALMQLKTN